MLQEFKAFALKGNVVDLAIGVIIGGAFGKIVESMVADIFMPIIGFLTGGLNFTNYFIQLAGPQAATYDAAKAAGATVGYGQFLTLAVNFMIVAFILFLIIKGMNKLKKEAEAAPAAPSQTEVLLAEIRDALLEAKKK